MNEITLEETINILTNLYNTARTIDRINDPVVWSLRQTLSIIKDPPCENNATYNNYDIVQNWKKEHPQGKKIECSKSTGLSRPTIDKYWT